MKKYILSAALVACLAFGACKGKSNGGDADTTSLNDGTGAPGSGTGSAGAGTVGDTTRTQQDTVNGAPQPKSPDTTKNKPSH